MSVSKIEEILFRLAQSPGKILGISRNRNGIFIEKEKLRITEIISVPWDDSCKKYTFLYEKKLDAGREKLYKSDK
jgi:hypothetical protein